MVQAGSAIIYQTAYAHVDIVVKLGTATARRMYTRHGKPTQTAHQNGNDKTDVWFPLRTRYCSVVRTIRRNRSIAKGLESAGKYDSSSLGLEFALDMIAFRAAGCVTKDS